MFYSGINHSIPAILNLNQCQYIEKKDKRIYIYFTGFEKFLQFNNNEERDNEFEKIKELLKRN